MHPRARFLPFLAALALAAGCSAPGEPSSGEGEIAAQRPTGPLEAGAKAPDFKLASTDGQERTLAGVTEKAPVFLYFLKYHCSGNPRAVPLLKSLAEAYGDKIQFLGVIDSGKADAEHEQAEYGMKFPLLLDENQSLIGAYGLNVSQHTYLVAQDGTIKQAFHGFGKEALESLNKAMAEVAGVEPAKVDLSAAPPMDAFG